MKILIFSDSHRIIAGMVKAVDRQVTKPDLIIHLGDLTSDADALRSLYPGLPLITVPGNNDWREARDPQECLLNLDGVKTLLLHGHTQAVKWGTQTLEGHAVSRGAQLVLFGHTHEPYDRYKDGLRLFNPGAAGIAPGGKASYGVLDIQKGEYVINVAYI
ncbi:MAG: YfcE family phosphodiesterase [Eubacteriales bacterium]